MVEEIRDHGENVSTNPNSVRFDRQNDLSSFREVEPMPVTMLNEARVPIECKNENCGVVHLYLVSDLAPNYSVRCLDCQQSIDLTSDQ